MAIGGSRKAVSDAAEGHSHFPPKSFSKFENNFGFHFLMRCCAILNKLFPKKMCLAFFLSEKNGKFP